MAHGRSAVIAPPALYTAGLLSPLLWLDPSDASSVTISSSSGAYIGNDGLVCPGDQSNYSLTPHIAPYAITGDLELVARAAPTTWVTPSPFFCKWVNGNRSYALFSSASGGLTLYLSANGTTILGVSSTANVSFAAGQTGWVKATFRASDRRVQFFTAPDNGEEPTNWTQLGDDVTHSTGTIFAGTAVIAVGANIDTGGNARSGVIKRTIIRNGIDGTTVFDADFDAASSHQSVFTESALGAPVYVVSSTAMTSSSGYSFFSANGLIPGSGYAWVADSNVYTNVSTTLDIMIRAMSHDWSSGVQSMVSKRGASGVDFGYSFRLFGGSLRLERGLSSTTLEQLASSTNFPGANGVWYWLRAVKDYTTGSVDFYYAADQDQPPSSWTKIGNTIAGSTTAQHNDTNRLGVGGYGPSENFVGVIKRAIVKCDATTVFDADFVGQTAKVTSFVESSSNGATVNISSGNAQAHAAGALVSQINDKSGSGNHVSQSTAGSMPRYWNGPYARNYLVFDGGDSLAGSSVELTIRTVFFVAKATGSANIQGAIFRHGGSPQVILRHDGASRLQALYFNKSNEALYVDTQPATLDAVHLLLGRYVDNVERIMRLNGAQIGSAASGSGTQTAITSSPTIGAWPAGSEYFVGLVGELAAYSQAVSDANLALLEGAINNKWVIF